MIYAAPGVAGAKLAYKAQYNNFIGGQWVAPVKGQYFDVITPTTGKVYTQAARSTAEDIDLALDAAHAAADKWGKTDAATRSNILLKIADRIEANLFFRVVSTRYESGSIFLTSNKHVRDWPEIFAGDEILTTAILDRLLHHVAVIHIDGQSYRLRELGALLSPIREGPRADSPRST